MDYSPEEAFQLTESTANARQYVLRPGFTTNTSSATRRVPIVVSPVDLQVDAPTTSNVPLESELRSSVSESAIVCDPAAQPLFSGDGENWYSSDFPSVESSAHDPLTAMCFQQPTFDYCPPSPNSAYLACHAFAPNTFHSPSEYYGSYQEISPSSSLQISPITSSFPCNSAFVYDNLFQAEENGEMSARPSTSEAVLAGPIVPAPSFDLGGPQLHSGEQHDEHPRTTRRSVIANTIGYTPTNPDTISSHDKKRHYLMCLERYISHLHEQMGLIGREPPPLERVSQFHGLSSRSIRTILVHMKATSDQLRVRRIAEERKFLRLRDRLCAMDPELLPQELLESYETQYAPTVTQSSYDFPTSQSSESPILCASDTPAPGQTDAPYV
ncbi:hypothetical protein FISHEDRAFT_75059 [Fistulina hepatica ATCC 64428]|uniref:Uncharacterized protein n=1 Tax=Fistulina hepatica ATCC 64428 TaxID=1128425 RepID=A0A0D7A8G9_9AGAR|nr:hypothetical protein FISHEDRAFT_75059 [Fistulina hepatica ATCC 64428]